MKKIFLIAEVIISVIAIFGLMEEYPFTLLAPLILLGFYNENKLIAFEEKIIRKWKCGKR